jgi:hypothetical protein
MSHSTNDGFSRIPFGCPPCVASAPGTPCAPVRGVCHMRGGEVGPDGEDCGPPIPLLGAWRPRGGEPVNVSVKLTEAPSFQSRACGIAQNPAAADDDRSSDNRPAAFTDPRATLFFRACEAGDVGARLVSPSRADAVGQNAEAFTPMRRADFRRRKESRCNAETHVDQVSGDHVEPKPQMPADVLEEAELWLALSDDSSDVGPEMSRIGLAESLAGDAERLARITAMYDVNQSPPRLAVKVSDVIPDWGRVQ